MEYTYYATHTRMGAWIVGILAAYFMHRVRNQRIELSKVVSSYLISISDDNIHNSISISTQTILLLGWFAALGMVLGVVFGNYPLQQIDNESTPLVGGLYHGITRVSWCMALGWIVFACHFGYGGPINWLLSLPIWIPFSRLTYAIYLLHLCIMMYITGQCRTSTSFSQLGAIHRSLGDLLFTVIIATLATLAFESPIVVFEKVLFHRQRNEAVDHSHKTESVTVTTKSQEQIIENGGSIDHLSNQSSTSIQSH